MPPGGGACFGGARAWRRRVLRRRGLRRRGASAARALAARALAARASAARASAARASAARASAAARAARRRGLRRRRGGFGGAGFGGAGFGGGLPFVGGFGAGFGLGFGGCGLRWRATLRRRLRRRLRAGLRRRRSPQCAQQRRALRAPKTSASVPTRARRIRAAVPGDIIVAGGDVAESAGTHLRLIDLRVQEAHRATKVFVNACDQASPQWGDRAGAPYFDVLAINAHLVRALVRGVAAHVGNAPAASARRRRRDIGPGLVRGLREEPTDPAARRAALRPAVPNDFAGDCASGALQTASRRTPKRVAPTPGNPPLAH